MLKAQERLNKEKLYEIKLTKNNATIKDIDDRAIIMSG